ncbi:MAG: prefoldin subunit alpha [Candidatus Bathyarchaeota archaeon]|nr:prefoldin subunit alpha [Candidatus Bathyarchaeota archaeon]MCZ2845510.1 prefoldin subunit alpha [Candidatus Bathyarchaeota archaeon]
MSENRNDEEDLRKFLTELKVLEGTANIIQSRLNIVDAALADIASANLSIEGVKNNTSGSEILVPVGGGSFIRAKLSDVEKVIVGVGADVCIEKTVAESVEDFKNRQSDLEKAKASLEQQLTQTLNNLNVRRGQAAEILKKRETAAL